MSKSLRVLFVEDLEDDTTLLLRELRRNGYEPTYERVEDAEAMTAALARQSWDIIVSDYSLPRFSGSAALALLKNSGLDLPFIIVSGTIGEETAVAALKAGAHDFLTKGYLARLIPAIERELREAESRRERRRAEEALHDREKLFRALIENAADVVSLVDAQGSIIYTSPAVTRVLGYTSEEYVGLNTFDLLHPDDSAHYTALFEQLLQQPGGKVAAQFRYQHKDGSWRWLEAVSSNLLAEPSVQAIVVNFHDVTERKQLEEQYRQAQKMEAIGRLSGGVAHDFNNILVVITGYSELLLSRYLHDNDEARKCVEEVKKAGERATTLTRQLLAFSRQQVLQPEVLDLNEVVANTEKMLRRLIGEDIDLITVPERTLRWIRVDPGQIEQVILNLVINARDAMPQGGKLVIKTANVELDETYTRQHVDVTPGPYVMLAVSDTGMGMDAETRSHIFEPFFTTKEQGKGTGLGLATVYGIVKQSGGDVWVYSEPERGTTFKIYLPRIAEETASALESRPDVSEQPGGTETVLLVEDEDAVRSLARQVLETSGYTVLAASHGGEALRLWEQQPGPIHLLLTDVVMPGGLNGRELAERLKPLYPGLKVLFMSGYTDEAIIHHGVLEPGLSYLQKPFTPNSLVQKVREVLDAPPN